MATILQLPNEILVNILESVRDMDHRSLLNVLFTSKRLNYIANKIFYEHVYFHFLSTSLQCDTPLSKFIQGSSANHHLVRSFTTPDVSAPSQAEGEALIDPIVRMLSSMTRLTSFSLRLKDHIWPNTDEDLMPLSAVIAPLIPALPSTLTSLEIDTYGRNTGDDKHHLCHLIGNLVPQLRILRLCLHHVCMDVMHQLQDGHSRVSQLRLAVIRLPQTKPHASYRCFCSPADPANRIKRSSEFAQKMLDIKNQGAFPWLQHFFVINCHITSIHAVGTRCYTRVRDLATKSTVTVPYRTFHDQGRRYIFRDTNGRDLIGSEEELASYVEGNFSWRELRNSSRLPPLLTCGDEKHSPHELGAATPLDRLTMRCPHVIAEMMIGLWDREKLVGTPILRATRIEGIDSELEPREILPPGWEFFQADDGWDVRQI